MGRINFPNNWIGNLWDGYELRSNGTCWRIREKINERSILLPPPFTSSGRGRAEAVATYNCEEIVQGKPNGKKAIIKVRMQVPAEFPVSFNPKVRAKLAEEQPGGWTLQEIHSLRHFNKLGCTVVPKLLNVVRSWQDESDLDMPVPNGSLVFVVMEKLPGVTLENFWEYDLPKRNKIREAFRRGLTELHTSHGRPDDCKLDNLIYNETNDKCYFVDFESIGVDEQMAEVEFSEDHLFIWGLARKIDCEPYF